MRKCKFPKCNRDARKGNTMCSRHYSAGDSIANDKRKHKKIVHVEGDVSKVFADKMLTAIAKHVLK